MIFCGDNTGNNHETNGNGNICINILWVVISLVSLLTVIVTLVLLMFCKCFSIVINCSSNVSSNE